MLPFALIAGIGVGAVLFSYYMLPVWRADLGLPIALVPVVAGSLDIVVGVAGMVAHHGH